MMTLIIIIEQVVIGGRTQGGVSIKLTNIECFLNDSAPRASLFRQLTQDAESSFRRFVIKNVRMFRVTNGSDAEFGGFDLEHMFHRAFEGKLERHNSILIQSERGHWLN